jgi:hypothetical protein
MAYNSTIQIPQARIAVLPPELLFKICEYLPTRDIRSLVWVPVFSQAADIAQYTDLDITGYSWEQLAKLAEVLCQNEKKCAAVRTFRATTTRHSIFGPRNHPVSRITIFSQALERLLQSNVAWNSNIVNLFTAPRLLIGKKPAREILAALLYGRTDTGLIGIISLLVAPYVVVFQANADIREHNRTELSLIDIIKTYILTKNALFKPERPHSFNPPFPYLRVLDLAESPEENRICSIPFPVELQHLTIRNTLRLSTLSCGSNSGVPRLAMLKSLNLIGGKCPINGSWTNVIDEIYKFFQIHSKGLSQLRTLVFAPDQEPSLPAIQDILNTLSTQFPLLRRLHLRQHESVWRCRYMVNFEPLASLSHLEYLELYEGFCGTRPFELVPVICSSFTNAQVVTLCISGIRAPFWYEWVPLDNDFSYIPGQIQPTMNSSLVHIVLVAGSLSRRAGYVWLLPRPNPAYTAALCEALSSHIQDVLVTPYARVQVHATSTPELAVSSVSFGGGELPALLEYDTIDAEVDREIISYTTTRNPDCSNLPLYSNQVITNLNNNPDHLELVHTYFSVQSLTTWNW